MGVCDAAYPNVGISVHSARGQKECLTCIHTILVSLCVNVCAYKYGVRVCVCVCA